MAFQLLRNGQIHILGSDCHNLKDRKPNMGEAIRVIQERLGQNQLDWVKDVEMQILNGTK